MTGNGDWYFQWAGNHLDTFGLGGNDAAQRAVIAWKPFFASLRYTADELAGATEVMARNPPKWISDHMCAIHDAIRSRRDRLARTGGECLPGDDGDRGECADCGNTGLVVVPHPKSIQHGVWVDRHTTAAYCRCRHGRWKADAWDRLPADAKDRCGGPLWSVEAYQAQVCPDWRQLVREREAAEADARGRWIGELPAKERDGVLRFGDFLDAFWQRHVRKA